MKKTFLAVCLLALALGAAQAQKLTGAGATFPYPIYSKWFSEYSAAHPGVEINYQSIGSGGGITQVTKGLVDFGASDMPMTDQALSASPDQAGPHSHRSGRGRADLQRARSAGLKFSPDVLADIYLGKINNWNDARIAKDNAGAKLPDQKIIVVHRAEGSGTSFIWTDYLSKVSKEWADGPGKGSALNWPAGVGGKGNEGVAGLVRQMPGAIGYVELIYALQNKINFGEVKNAAGNFVKASIEGVTDAAASVKQMPADYRISITNAPGANAYPDLQLHLPADPHEAGGDATKRKVLKDMLSWILKSGEGEVSQLSYAPLPEALQQKVLNTVYSLQ